MEAVVTISGKQYRVSEGQRLTVDRLQNPVGEEVSFDHVLMLSDGVQATVGTPIVDGAVVKARVVAESRGPKIVVYKYKPKKRHRRTQGFRAAQSVLEVLAVTSGGKTKAAAKAEAKPTAAAEKAAPAKPARASAARAKKTTPAPKPAKAKDDGGEK